MKLGAFLMPTHPPERSVSAGQQLDLRELEELDVLGFHEAWIGEHFTAAWEPCPAPDLLIAAGLSRTRTLRLGSLGHLLPYHNPVELAHRVAYLDHLALGRYNVGVGISALPTDHQLFDLAVEGGRNRRMTFEALRVMTGLWKNGASTVDGEFWSAGAVNSDISGLGYHLRPCQQPHPPIAIAAMTAGSQNHLLAGAEGYLPVSLTVSPLDASTAAHWDTVEAGAMQAGRTADRDDWRIVRDVYVAPTDDEARTEALEGMMGRCWREFLLPLYLSLGLGPLLKTDPDMSDDDITLDYLSRELWIVGSPETVTRRIVDLNRAVGGFGVLVATSYDCLDDRAAWQRHLRLLATEVMPTVSAQLASAAHAVPSSGDGGTS